MTPIALTVRDLERLQRDRPDLCMELVNGEIRIASPSGGESEAVSVGMAARLPDSDAGANPTTATVLTVRDLEGLQRDRPELPMELVNGEIRIMSPSGGESEEVCLELGALLRNWVRPRRLGRVFGSSAGFVLPNKSKDVRAPDVSFVRADRLKQSPTGYIEVVPDLMVEVRSPTDSLTQLRQKIQSFLEVGVQVGVLVDPKSRTVEVYRPAQETPQVLRDGDVLAVPDLLPGWSVAISDLWPLVF